MLLLILGILGVIYILYVALFRGKNATLLETLLMHAGGVFMFLAVTVGVEPSNDLNEWKLDHQIELVSLKK